MASKSKQNLAGLIFRPIFRFTKKVFTHARFQVWALWAAGPIFLLVYGGQLAIILASWWPEELRGEQLKYVGIGSWIMLGLLGASMFFMADVVKRLSLRFGMTEIELETQDDDGEYERYTRRERYAPRGRYNDRYEDDTFDYGRIPDGTDFDDPAPGQHPENGGGPGRSGDGDRG